MQSTASISINSQIHSRIYWNLLLSLKIKSLSMILISSFLVIKLLVLLFTQIMTITNKISNFITTLFPLLLVYIGRPLFHVLLDAYKVLPSYSFTLLSVASITARFPSSRGLQMLLMAGTKALSQPASVHLAQPDWAVTPTWTPSPGLARFRHFSTHSRSRDETMTRTVCQVTELSTRSPLLNSAQCLISPGQYLQLYILYSENKLLLEQST